MLFTWILGAALYIFPVSGAEHNLAHKEALTTGSEAPAGIREILPRWTEEISAKRKSIIEQMIKNMVFVEGGTFTMGATAEQGTDAFDDEKPAHKVTLSSYYIGKYEVTQEEWEAVMGTLPYQYTPGKKNPVDGLNFKMGKEFIERLNSLTGLNFSLPTEAQWEYAARGGEKSKGFKFSGSHNINEVGWYEKNSKGQTHPVGSLKPNELGLFDMTGNVWEMCEDRDGEYSAEPQFNPTGRDKGVDRVHRGGGQMMRARYCRVSFRRENAPSKIIVDMGVRLVLNP